MSGLLVIALVAQFKARRYIPGLYWLSVVLISVVGTLITDNLTDNLGVSLVTTTIIFAVCLVVVFAVWYASEKTLSIHSVHTTKREAFYWSAILFTFALGTAAGDLTAEKLDVGYWKSGLIFGGLIAVITMAHYTAKRLLAHDHRRQTSNAVLAFWLAYILTRPLGASIGDYLSQPHDVGGLNLGTVGTSAIFLGTILATVVFLTITRKDELPPPETTDEEDIERSAAHKHNT